MWFQKKPTLPTEPVVYPSGTFVRTVAAIWYIKGGKRFRLLSDRVLDAWHPARVVYTSEEALVKYRKAGRLGFRDGSLINNIADARIYLVSENKRRLVTSPDVLARLGATGKDVVVVSDAEINLHSEGEPLA